MQASPFCDDTLSVIPQSLRDHALACGLHRDEPERLDMAWSVIVGFLEGVMRDTLAGNLHSLHGDMAYDLSGPHSANDLLKYLVMDRPLWLDVQKRLFNPRYRSVRPLIRTYEEGGRIYLRPGVLTVFVGDPRHISADQLGLKSRIFSLLGWQRGVIPGGVLDTVRLLGNIHDSTSDDDLTFAATTFLRAVVAHQSLTQRSADIQIPRPIGIMWRETILDEFAYAAFCCRHLRMPAGEIIPWDKFRLPSWSGTGTSCNLPKPTPDCDPQDAIPGDDAYARIFETVRACYFAARRSMSGDIWAAPF